MSLKQITITEAFKKAKMHSFKMDKVFYRSSVTIDISSDEDENENSQYSERVDIECSLLKYHTELQDISIWNSTGPSPPKKARILNDSSNDVDSTISIIGTLSAQSKTSPQNIYNEDTVLFSPNHFDNYKDEQLMLHNSKDLETGKSHTLTENNNITVTSNIRLDVQENGIANGKTPQSKACSIKKSSPTKNISYRTPQPTGWISKSNKKKIVENTSFMGSPQASSSPNITTSSQNTQQPTNNITSSARKQLFTSEAVSVHQNSTRNRYIIDDQKPCSSKSLIAKNQATDKEVSAPKKIINKNATSVSTPTSSPNKKESNTLQSPSKPKSPRKYGELKNLKAKDGKQLQIKQLKLLVNLFKSVMKAKHFKNLLNQQETQFLYDFVIIEDTHKYVIMKLCVWKRSWYNIYKFCTKAKIEVNDDKHIIEIFQNLAEKKFVNTDYLNSADMDELLQELDAPAIKEVMDYLRIKPNTGKKDDLICNIIKATSTQNTLTKKPLKNLVKKQIRKKLGNCIKIKDEVYNAFFNAYLLATFTNPQFDDIQTYFRLIIHSSVVFPETKIEDYPVFSTRDSFLDFSEALKLKKQLDFVNPKAKYEILQIGRIAFQYLLDDTRENLHKNAPHLKRYTATHVYQGILTKCSELVFSKQNGKPEEVKEWLEKLISKYPTSGKLGKWYHVLIWLHMRHLETISYEKAAEILLKAFEDHGRFLGERDRQDLRLLGEKLKLSKKHKIVQILHDKIADLVPPKIDTKIIKERQIDSMCIRSDISGKKRIYRTKSEEGCTYNVVEDVALEYYREDYPDGRHCEGELIKGLLILYFWDIIYDPEKPVPGTFISELQSAPLDIFTPYFYKNRKELIENRLKEIELQWSSEKLLEFGETNYQNHSHELAVYDMVVRQIEDKKIIEQLITSIGRRVLSKIFGRLIRNMGEFSSGMPDLLVWNHARKMHKFVEVKGENDKLAVNQQLWLVFLHEIGADVEVCWVHSMGSKRKNINSKRAENEILNTD